MQQQFYKSTLPVMQPSFTWYYTHFLRSFHIKSNAKKALLFKVLNAENSTSLIHKTINKLWGIPENIETSFKKQDSMIENLSIKAIKIKLNSMFYSRQRTPNCSWQRQVDNEHAILRWPKTVEWQKKWNELAIKEVNDSIYNILKNIYSDIRFD